MSVIDDLKNLSSQQRRFIQRAAGKLRKMLPTTHTIIINRKPGLQKAVNLTDFELTVLVNAESEAEKERTVSESLFNKGSGKVSAPCRIYTPGYAYIQSSREVDPDEAEALTYEYEDVYDNSRQAYLELLKKHLKLFVKDGSMNVITVNAPEMEKGNPLYYKLYTINLYLIGYVIYNRDIQPIVTIQKRI